MGCGSSTRAVEEHNNFSFSPGSSGAARSMSGSTPSQLGPPATLTRDFPPSKPLTEEAINNIVRAEIPVVRVISSGDLENKRREFWTTRTGGNNLMWSTIRCACEAIVGNDISLANAILEASSISTPSACVNVCYDERGYMYQIPSFCYSNSILNDIASKSPQAKLLSDDLTRVSPSKKAVAATPLHLKIRINPGDHNIVVQSTTADSILQLKKCIQEQSVQAAIPISVGDEDGQRVIFMGKELKNAQLIGDTEIDENRVVQVFLRPPKAM